MATITKSSKSDYTLIDEGVYRMRFDAYEEPIPSTFKEGAYTIKTVFVIEDPESDFHGEELHQIFGWSLHPKSRLYPVIKAMNGGDDIEDGEVVDIDDYKGRRFMGTVTHVTKRGQDGTDNTYANLTAAVPIRKKKSEPAAPAKKAKPAVDEDDGDELFGDADAA